MYKQVDSVEFKKQKFDKLNQWKLYEVYFLKKLIYIFISRNALIYIMEIDLITRVKYPKYSQVI